MRRSLAPSALFKRRKLDDEDSPPDSLLGSKGKPINHLARWDPSNSDDTKPEEDANSAQNDVEQIRKNYTLNPNAIPVCFACTFTALNKLAKKDAKGDGSFFRGKKF
jgi:hypothetical protein